MQQTTVLQILDAIEHQSFIEQTYLASDYQLVGEIIRRTPEVKSLLEDKDTSFPFILARYQERKDSMTYETYLAYFVIFGMCQNVAAIPELVSYLISCRVEQGERAPFFFPWHPFFHAAEALAVLTHNQIPIPAEEEIKNNIDIYFECIRQWIIKQV